MTSFLVGMLAIFMASSCDTKNPEPVPEPTPDPVPEVKVEILSAGLAEYPTSLITIDDETSSIEAVLPYGSVLGKATLVLELPQGCTSDPVSGTKMDITRKFNIFVTSQTGAARKYTFSARVAASDIVKFKWLMVEDYLIKGEVDGMEVTFTLPYGADLTSLKIDIEADYALTTDVDMAGGIDLSSPREVRFYAEDKTTYKTYILKAKHFAKDDGVRAIYLPSPSHTSAFGNYTNLCKSMDLLQELNFNCLFVCAWAQTKTAWPSEVLLANSTYSSLPELNMYRTYTGGSGDAVADMISEGHKRGIKVILWFEYGFMHAAGGVNMSDPLLAKHPDWIGLNESGEYCNYNGSDFYLNAYSPQVQKFMIDLIVEAVNRYPDLDGIQGDDRLPASPRNSGYNKETVEAYMSQTGNSYPGGYKTDQKWVDWRMDNLNAFAVSLHDAVKAANSRCLVCFAPNKHPWAYNNLSQDWPTWVKTGACEFLTVQCYVTANYERDVDSQIKYLKEVTAENIFQPAMILKNGERLLSPQMISEELCYNRKVGTRGEAQFWFDGLYNEDIRKMFRLFYSYPVEFPAL